MSFSSSVKSTLKFALLLTLSISVSGVSSCKNQPPANTVELTIVHTNDLHSHFKARPSTTSENPFGLGGLAKLATIVGRIKAKKPNAVVLDAGDWSEGTVYYNVDAGENMLRLMDAVGYNAIVVGNHDFLNGPSQVAGIIKSAKPHFAVLGANKNVTGLPDQALIKEQIKDYVILDKGGVRIAVIGLLTEELFYQPYFRPGIITNPVERASQLATYIHNNNLADVIVLLSHNKLEKNYLWAKQVPFVNVVVSGHSHVKTAQPLVNLNAGRPAYVVEAYKWGQYVGELTLSVDLGTKKATLKNYVQHPVTPDTPEQLATAAIIRGQDAYLESKYGAGFLTKPIASSEHVIRQSDSRETPLVNIAADAYRSVSKADIGLEASSLQSLGIAAGPLTMADLVNVSPRIFNPKTGRGWTVQVVALKGFELRLLFEMAMAAQGIGLPLGGLGVSGAQVTYTSSGGLSPLQTVKVLDPDLGTYLPIKNAETYTIALHDGLLLALREIAARPGFTLIDLSNREDTGIETGFAIARFLKGRVIRGGDFEAGIRVRSLEADLSLYEHDVSLSTQEDGSKLIRVTVKNEGFVDSGAGSFSLRILRSAANDILADTTDNQKVSVNADILVPLLAPGERTTLEMPWRDIPQTGIYSLRVRLETFVGAADANIQNNGVVVYEHAEKTTSKK